MNRIANFAQRTIWTLLLCCAWLSLSQPAWAKKHEDAPPPPVKSYALPYALVILSLAFGLLVVCRPSHRQDTIKRKPTDEEEDEH